MDSLNKQKEALRKKLKKKRKLIPLERRKKASLDLQSYILQLPFEKIVSFYSFGDEIDVTALNQKLAEQKRLVLPKIKGHLLFFYLVKDLKKDLIKHPFGFFEPCESKCPLVKLSKDFIILVPGLGFDLNKHRIGYGKGFYDRLLREQKAFSLGVGFKEQLLKTPIPTGAHDVALQELYLT